MCCFVIFINYFFNYVNITILSPYRLWTAGLRFDSELNSFHIEQGVVSFYGMKYNFYATGINIFMSLSLQQAVSLVMYTDFIYA